MFAKNSKAVYKKRITKLIAIMTISALVLTIWTMLFLPNATDPDVELKVIGEEIKTIEPGENAIYPIRVENKGDVNEDIRLETFGTPEGWWAGLDKEKVNLDSGKRDHVILTVKSPLEGTRGTPVAKIGVRALVGSGLAGAKNQTLIETVTWSYNLDKITVTPGDYRNATKIVTTVDSAVVYELPDIINVSHVDESGDEFDGTTFYRDITVPVDVSVIITADSSFEMGYVGSYDYFNRNETDGNPIQGTVELKSTTLKGTVYVNVEPRGGTRADGKNPMIEIISGDNSSVGSIDITIPYDSTGGLFSIGIIDGNAEVEVFNGAVDLEVKETETTQPYVNETIEASLTEAPKGVTIDKVNDTTEINITGVNKDVITIKGEVDVKDQSLVPPIKLSPTQTMILIDPNNIPELNIESSENYNIEVKKYRKDTDVVDTITVEGIEAGGVDTFKFIDDTIVIKTTSDIAKTIEITVEKDGKTYTVELPLTYKNNEEYILKDIDVDKGTATILINDEEGNKIIELEEIKSGTDNEGVIKEREKEEKPEEEEEFPIKTICPIVLLIIVIIVILVILKKGKKEDKEVKELMKKIEEEEEAEEKEPMDKEAGEAEEGEKESMPLEEKDDEQEVDNDEPTEEKEEVSPEEKVPTPPIDEIEQIYAEGVEFYKGGDFELAIENFDMTIAADPNHERAFFNKGFVLRKLDEDEEALKCFDRAIELNPEYEKAWYSKGFTLRKLERYEEALYCFEKALELNPEYENAKKGCEICKEELGYTPDAEEEVEFEVDDEEGEEKEPEEKEEEEKDEVEKEAQVHAEKSGKSYYKVIDGERYDRELLDTANELIKNKEVELLNLEDAEKLWVDAEDAGKVTDVESKTIEYIINNINCTESAKEYLREKIDKLKE